MSDVYSKEKRSYVMSQIKGRDTKPEMIIRKYLFSNGFRYRVHIKQLPGSPDIVLRKYKTIILVHGCFWHGHENCKIAHIPKTRTEWWKNKIERNIARDKKIREELRSMGWNTLVVWECQLLPKSRKSTLEGISTLLYHAYLEQFRVKPYKVDNTEEVRNIAAEDIAIYGEKVDD